MTSDLIRSSLPNEGRAGNLWRSFYLDFGKLQGMGFRSAARLPPRPPNFGGSRLRLPQNWGPGGEFTKVILLYFQSHGQAKAEGKRSGCVIRLACGEE